jgi:NAD(P)-dependent dehydrogenase (short-subunit alcohol dehydrogenase family)
MLVTGASRGIGRATALLAAEHGYALCLNYVSDAAAAQSLKAEIDDIGVESLIVHADVSSDNEVTRLFTTIDKHFGRLDVLVNNAGIVDKGMRLEDMSVERISRIMAVNVTGAMLCAREAVRRLSTRHGGRGGSIINVSSRAAVLGAASEYVDYAASKGAIDTLTVGLANEVANEGIRVNAVRPGLIETDIHASGGDAHRVARLTPGVPMQRGGSAREVAEAILWLASSKAAYTTGSFIEVSGGR